MADKEMYRIDIVVDVEDGAVTPKMRAIDKVLDNTKKRADILNRTKIDPTVSLQDKISGSLRTIEGRLSKLGGVRRVVIEGVDRVSNVLKRITSTLTSPLVLLGMGSGAVGIGALVKDFVMTGGRTETLNIAMNAVAKSTGTPMDELLKQRQAVMDLGIAEQEATQVMTRFMQSNLDIAQASQISRVAQDAAVIAGVNSSAATETMVEAVAKLSPEMLSSFGMTKNMNTIFAEHAERIGIVVKTTDKYGKTVRHMTRDLTEAEKKQGMLNYIIEEGAKISGTYESAMGSAFKKLGSLTRYWTDFKTKVGIPLFLGAFGKTIDALTDAFKRGIEWAETNQHVLEQWGRSIEEVVNAPIKRLNQLFSDETFQKMNWGDRVVYVLDQMMISMNDWISGEGGQQVEKVFVKLAEIGIRAWLTALGGMVKGSVQALFSGNIVGSAGLAIGAGLLGGGMLLRGAWGLGKGLFGAGKWGIGKIRGLNKFKATTTTPLAGGHIPAEYGMRADIGAAEAAAKTPAIKAAATPATKVIAGATSAMSKTGEGLSVVSKAMPYLGKAAKVAGNVVRRVALPLAVATDVYDLATSQNKVKTGAGIAGGWGGMAAGAALGTALLPGIGTIVGGALGYFGGNYLGQKIAEYFQSKQQAAPISSVTELPMAKAAGEVGVDQSSFAAVGETSAILASFNANLQNAATNIIARMGSWREQAGNIAAIASAFSANLQAKATDIIAKMGAWSDQAWGITAISVSFAANLQRVADRIITNGSDLAAALADAASRAVSFSLPVTPVPAVAHAAGGIVTSPHLGLVGEAGPELILPLSARMKGRALDLWQQAGEYLGVSGNRFMSPMPAFTTGIGDLPSLDLGQQINNTDFDYSPVGINHAGGGLLNVSVSIADITTHIHGAGLDNIEEIAEQVGEHVKDRIKREFVREIANDLENRI